MLVGMWPMAAQAAIIINPPDLRSAANFSVLAGTALTCTDSSVTGPVGVNFRTAPTLTGPTCHQIHVQYAPGAYADFRTAYLGIAGSLGCTTANTLTTLAGPLAPGTYCVAAGATMTGVTLTLTGGFYLFEIGTGGVGALTGTNFTVVGGDPCNTFWWVRNDVTLTDSTFEGTILGGGDITLTRTSLDGRAFATGAVTMTGSSVFGCAAATNNRNGKEKCNQGVGNGPEGCDPGKSNQGDKSRSNDELGGTPGNPGRQGGNGK
jgi:Ice-binding-like